MKSRYRDDGWEINRYLEAFIVDFCGVSILSGSQMASVDLFNRYYCEDHSFSDKWFASTGEFLIPVAHGDSAYLCISQVGKFYAEYREVKEIAFYGEDYIQGMYNFIKGGYISVHSYEFDLDDE